jgi:tetratricopeptide (TPR) repeat protein
LLLTSSKKDPNELKSLWDLAREFRDYARSSPEKADYVLYADYTFNPQQWEQGMVHFVVCDRTGEWTIVDLQNSHQPDYQSVRPVSVQTCDALLIRRLSGYLKISAADALRETIQASGLDAAKSKFAEIRSKKDEYLVAEDQINNLGYEYLQAGKIKEAIAVFTLNTEAFPESFNAFDSLGEAYAAAGEKEQAVRNYRKSLELNPQSQSGIEALKKLEMH